METLWFWLVAAMITLYVIFDGFDLGAGALHLLVGRTEEDRRLILRSIGPVWDGNEVWLLAAGGTLFFAFPVLYASSFSGFYLPLMIVLWLLMLRGIAIEFRNHIRSAAWVPLWDVIFSVSSALLAIFFGAALGNVVRGVPLDASGRFFEPLWTDFRPGPNAGILDWYTVLVGLAALAALSHHGARWIALKTDGALRDRARRAASRAWIAVAALTIAVTGFTLALQPQVWANLRAHPGGAVFPALTVAGLLGALRFGASGNDAKSFLASAVYLAGLLTSAAFGLYPYVLPASTEAAYGLTVATASAPAHGLRIGLIWWVPGMLLASLYVVFAYGRFAGKVSPTEDEGY